MIIISFLQEHRHQAAWLGAIFIVAFAIRVFLSLMFPAIPESDAADYYRLGLGLYEGSGFVAENGQPTAWRPPGYPFFLFFVFSTLGTSITAIFVFNALLGAATAVILAVTGMSLFGDRVGITAGCLAAVHQSFSWMPRILASENLSIFLIAAGLFLLVLYLQSERIWLTGLIGLLLGISLLVRGANIFIVAVFMIAGVAAMRAKKKNIKHLMRVGAVFGAGFILVLAPWIARNSNVFGRISPLTTQEGAALYCSYFPPARDGRLIWGNLAGTEDPFVAGSYAAGDELAVSAALRRTTFDRLSAEPSRVLRLLPQKFLSLLVPFDWEWFPHERGGKSLNWTYILFSILAAVGAFVVLRRRDEFGWVVWLLPTATVLQTAVFYGSPRFRVQAEISIVLLAAVGIWNIFSIRKTPSATEMARGPANN